MDNMIKFNFESNEVRVVKDKQDGLCFVVKDISDALGLSTNSRKGVKDMTIISIFDLDRLLMRSSKPKIKRFLAWVTKEVVPSINF